MQEAIRQFGWKTRWERVSIWEEYMGRIGWPIQSRFPQKLLAWQCRWRGEKRFAELLEAMPRTAIGAIPIFVFRS